LKIIGDKGLATPDIQYLTPSQVGGIRSNATSPGKSPGEHTMANGEVSMSSRERAKASNATSPGKSPGEHTMANGEVSMSSRERGAAGGVASHATSPGKSQGEHTMANGKVSMSSKERAKASHVTSPGKSPGEHTMANGKVSMSSKERLANASAHMTSEDRRKSMLVRPMNGTAHLNPNAEEDFIHHCAMAKKLFEQVSRYYLLLTIKQLY
jgi:hypothetical protein